MQKVPQGGAQKMTGKLKTTSGYIAPEQGYRTLQGLNQSMLKTFDEDIGLFYQQFILGHEKQEKPSSAVTIGSVVDFILLDCNGDEHQFDQRVGEKFVLYDGVKSSAQAFELADELFKTLMRSRDGSTGEITADFGEAFREAFATLQAKEKYKGKTWEKGLEDFNKTAKEYFDKKVANIGKTIVDLWELEKAKNIVQQAKGDEFLGAWVNQESNDEMEVIKKHIIEFEIAARHQKWKCKMEQDETRIDHVNKIIYRIDHKTNYDNENFDYSYLKRKYYLQSSFYDMGTRRWAKAVGLDGYEVLPMEFIVYDTSINNRRPLRYKTTEKHVSDGLVGFLYKGQWYKGALELIEEIDWANENGIWNISRNNYISKGVVELKNYWNE